MTSPISHAAGMGNFSHVLAGARHVITRAPSFDPAEIFALSEKFGNCFLFAAPTMVKRLAEYAQETGASVEVLDPLETQVDSDAGYVEVMTDNLAKLREALECS